mmetsp:Transcript_12564/g.25890  ORF Transcript_12564/g.25890 Transcript_12564/m.25890 type:complete len:269 (-) Transcript_12564:7-813(-)
MGDIAEEVVTTLTSPLDHVTSLSGQNNDSVRAVSWGGKGAALCSVSDHAVQFWGSDASALRASSLHTFDSSPTPLPAVSQVAWDPFSSSVVAIASRESIVGVDSRSSKDKVFSVNHAHALAVRAVDYSPSSHHALISGGDDGCVRWWDLRRPTKANSKVISDAHTHAAAACKFCPASDKLLASSGTDGYMRLWETSSAFQDSSQSLSLSRRQTQRPVVTCGEADGRRLDSLYALAWTPREKWHVAGLSYDGRLVVHAVPQAVKYAILL